VCTSWSEESSSIDALRKLNLCCILNSSNSFIQPKTAIWIDESLRGCLFQYKWAEGKPEVRISTIGHFDCVNTGEIADYAAIRLIQGHAQTTSFDYLKFLCHNNHSDRHSPWLMVTRPSHHHDYMAMMFCNHWVQPCTCYIDERGSQKVVRSDLLLIINVSLIHLRSIMLFPGISLNLFHCWNLQQKFAYAEKKTFWSSTNNVLSVDADVTSKEVLLPKFHQYQHFED
jgi:hypothetical protein